MWNLAYADLSRVALGVHAVSNTSVLVAGGGGPIQAGPAVFASEDAGATWAAAPGIKLSMVNAIGASPHAAACRCTPPPARLRAPPRRLALPPHRTLGRGTSAAYLR